MHPNKAFRNAARKDNISFVRDRGFGVLTVVGLEWPLASHIPFVLSDDVTVLGAHLVRSNPILKLLEEPAPTLVPALLVVSGPDAYISPDWYGIDDQVPTWNYVAVHLRGKLKRLPADQLRPHLTALSAQFEKRLSPKPQWELDKVSRDAMAKLERMIVPVEMTIESIDGTWKLAQNKPESARLGAADGLAQSIIGQMVSELADLMRDVE